ncbi:MAG TPA: SusC/RagA family TonB-linked outer membrane protein [Parasegetibacter sp.]
MKMTVLMMMAFCLQLSATTLSQTISLSGSNFSIRKIITEIEKQTDYNVFLNQSDLKGTTPVSVHAEHMDLQDFLQLVFKNQPLEYFIAKKNIILSRKPVSESNDFSLPADIDNMAELYADSVKGQVRGPDGVLPGASIRIKGRREGTMTDVNGRFSIAAKKGQVLIVSYAGMETKEVEVTEDNQTLNIELKLADVALDEVVVNGYFSQNKNSFTGNSIQVSREQMLKVGPRNIIEILQVFDPSFRIQQNLQMGSDPNTLPEFYIRGQSSIGALEMDIESLSRTNLMNNPNLPLFIMDGYEISVTRLYDFDLNRIENITLLKDAAATAIYGSRASNGVVVIETKRPKAGKFSFTYNVTGSVTAPDLTSYNLMDAAEKLTAEVAAGAFTMYDNSGAPSLIVNKYLEYHNKMNNVLKGVNTYWLSQPLRTGFSNKHSLYVEGGENSTRYGIELRHDLDAGVMKGSDRGRSGGGIYIDYRIKNFQFRNHVTLDRVKGQNSPLGSFADFTRRQPYDQIYDDQGNIVRVLPEWTPTANRNLLLNPFFEATLNNSDRSLYTELVNNLSMQWQIHRTLQFRGQLSFSKKESEDESFTDPESGKYYYAEVPRERRGDLSISKGRMFNWNTNLLLVYNNMIDRSVLSGSLGVNVLESKLLSERYAYQGFPSGELNSINYANEVVGKPNISDARTRTAGIFSTINYSFDNTYFADFSLRMDGSSQFGRDKKYAPFWSAGVGVNLHEFSALNEMAFLDRLKLRGSVGQTGKITFPPHAAKHMYTLWVEQYSTGYGGLLTAMGNTNLKWERKNSINVGMDLEMLNQKLSFTLDFYRDRTKDQITNMTIPSSAGFLTYMDNVGEVQNKGVEMNARYTAVRTKNTNLSIFANLASNKNSILKISEAMAAYNRMIDEYYADYTGNNRTKEKYGRTFLKYVEGGSLTSIFGMQSMGINPANGKEVYEDRFGDPTYEWIAADQVIIGNTEPTARGAFGINAQWKSFSFNVAFLYEWGGDRYNNTLVSYVESADVIFFNADRRVLSQRWQKPGDLVPLKDIADRALVTRPTSRFVQRYNAIDIASLSIGYDLPASLAKRIGLSMARVQVSTNNLANISTVRQERGLDYPFARVFNFGIQVSF